MRSSGKLLLALALILAVPVSAQTLSAGGGGCASGCTLPGTGNSIDTNGNVIGSSFEATSTTVPAGYGVNKQSSTALGLFANGVESAQIFAGAINVLNGGAPANSLGPSFTAFNNSNHEAILGITGTTYSTAPFSADQVYLYGAANAGGLLVGTPGATPLTLTVNNSSGLTITSAGAIQLPLVATGTNADFVCMSAGNILTLQTSACTISSRRFKENIEPLETDALALIAQLQPVTFNMKPGSTPNPDPNFGRNQIGLIAENVAAVDPRMAIYEDDGVTPKSYRQESVIAALVAAVNELQTCRLRVMGHCWF